jgi:hypothetical protein
MTPSPLRAPASIRTKARHFSSLVMPGLDPGIHRKKRFIEEDGLPRHKRVHAHLPTRYARQ